MTEELAINLGRALETALAQRDALRTALEGVLRLFNGGEYLNGDQQRLLFVARAALADAER